MKVRVDPAGVCRKILHIEVPKDQVDTERAKVVKAYARAARIPGFRPGHAPAHIVEQRYAKDIAQETRDALVPQCYRDALKQESITPVSIINVSDSALVKGQDFVFDVIVDVVPEFELPAYKGVVLQGKRPEVTDQAVEETIERIRDGMARFEDIAGRAVQAGDFIRIDYAGTCEGRPFSEVAPDSAAMGEGKDFWMMVSEGAEDFLPGLSRGLTGATVGETREVAVTFPTDYRVGTVAGRQASYRVTVQGIREKKLPEIDGEFLKAVEAESLDALRKKVREDLGHMAEAEEKRRLRGEVVKVLLAQAEIRDLPQSVVEEETRHVVREIVYENVRRGVPKDAIEEKKDDILGTATESSTERIKASYVLGRIAEQEHIEVTEQDLDREIQVMAARYRMHPAKLRTELEKRNALDGIRSDVRSRKTLDFVLENAVVKSE